MRAITALCLSLFLCGTSAWAACTGVDLRNQLSASQSSDLQSRLRDQPFRHGNHWVATKEDVRLNIIGTLHLDDPRHDAIVKQLKPVLQGADLLLVEATEAEEKALENAMALQPDVMFIQTGPSLIDMMSAEEWAALSEAAQARGIPSFMAAKFQPWYLSLVLGLPPCVMQQMAQGGRGLDHRIMAEAKKAGVPTAALEPWDTLFEIFGNDPIEDQIEMLKLSVMLIKAAEDTVATLVAQYFDEDHGAVMDTSRVITRAQVDMAPVAFDTAFDALLENLLVARNLAWMDVIAAQKDTRIVIAVGAGHLSGPHGILQMLQNVGYKMERQPF
ncbi:TraB/GumN family protein [Ascidiaceihabitans sp.]|uniref:TraB/GumN family protein n=1 Tax=Ascidiaceihabitans sp. TaxID=1872644 RepID=UPI0032971E24